MRLRFGDAVVILDLVGHLQRAAGLTFRIFGQRNGRGAVGSGAELPLRLTGGRADMRGAVAGDGEMPFVGALGRLLGRHGFGHAAAGHHIERAAARAHDQRAARRHRQRSRGGCCGFLVRRRQNDRRLAGIERRRHPGIDPDIGRRQHAVPVERRGDPRACARRPRRHRPQPSSPRPARAAPRDRGSPAAATAGRRGCA